MANQEHLKILKRGTATWNEWRKQHPEIRPDLSRAALRAADIREANLSGADLSGAYLNFANLSKTDLSKTDLSRAALSGAFIIRANLNGADLSGANLSGATLSETNLSGANLSNADLRRVNLSETNLSNTILIEAYLYRANLSRADLSEANLRLANLIDANLIDANLSRADLSFATFVRTNLTKATLTECRIYGISAWDVELTGASQDSLVITPPDEPEIKVDNLKIAQFIYLLLNNQEIREVIDTIAKKAVLILGRFTPERKAILDAIRNELRTYGYVPILFDFDKPSSRDLTETVTTLAHLSRFVIADLTTPSSIPHELASIVKDLPSVPFQPLIHNSQHEYGMFEHIQRYPWVLPIYHYEDQTSLLQSLKEHVIDPAEHKAQELTQPA